MKKYAIILAGGSGLRAGGDVPKQFHMLCGRPLLWWSMKAFTEAIADVRVVTVLHPDYLPLWKELDESIPECERIPCEIAPGGVDRMESVRHGLIAVADLISADAYASDTQNLDAVVLVHDGARPLVDAALIRRGLDSLRAGKGTIPVIKAVNSLRRVEIPGAPLGDMRSESVDRSAYVEVQTPQIFHFSTLQRAYFNAPPGGAFTDDASVAEASGVDITLYEGAPANIKVTHPTDFRIAEALLAGRAGMNDR